MQLEMPALRAARLGRSTARLPLPPETPMSAASISRPVLEARSLSRSLLGRDELLGARARRSAPSTTSASRCGRGTVTALVGESGSGKSTVARLLDAALRADRRARSCSSDEDVSRHPRPPPAPSLPVAGADDLPGPVRVAEPRQAASSITSRARSGSTASSRATRCDERVARAARDGRARPRRGRRREVSRTSSPAGSGSASRSRARWPSSRRSCSPTSRSRCSTSRSASGS